MASSHRGWTLTTGDYPRKYDDYIARLVISEGGFVSRSFEEASGEKPVATVLERIENVCQYFKGNFTTRTRALQRSPETLYVALKSVEYLVPELIIRAFGAEALQAYQTLMTFFLCWNRCTGVTPTLNVSLLLKRYICTKFPAKRLILAANSMFPVTSTDVEAILVTQDDIRKLCKGQVHLSFVALDKTLFSTINELLSSFLLGYVKHCCLYLEHTRTKRLTYQMAHAALQVCLYDANVAIRIKLAADFEVVVRPTTKRYGYHAEWAMQRHQAQLQASRHARIYRGAITTRSARSGLQFSVYMAEGIIRGVLGARRNRVNTGLIALVGGGAPIYLAAVMEYLTAEVVELSGNVARGRGTRDFVTPDCVRLGIENDEELNRLLQRIPFADWQWAALTQASPQEKDLDREALHERWSVNPLRSNIASVHAQVHPHQCLTPRAMTVVVHYVGSLGLLIAQSARSLTSMHRKRTLSSREIQSAVRLLLPSELQKHAVSEGTKAVTKFHCY